MTRFEETTSQNGRAEKMLSELAERVGKRAGVDTVYGDAVERDGVTVIPVAKVRWAFGGGGGRGEDEAHHGTGEGTGGGGGVSAAPMGYIEIRDGEARFVRISDTASYWPLALAGGLGLCLLLRGLRGLLR